MPETLDALSTSRPLSTAQVRVGRPFGLTEAWEPLVRVTTLDRLLTLRLSSEPFPSVKHWAKRLLPGKNIQALHLPVRANFGTSLDLRIFINKLGRASTPRGCKTHPNQAPPAESPFLLQTQATDPEFFWFPLQGSDVAEWPSVPQSHIALAIKSSSWKPCPWPRMPFPGGR